MVVGLDKKEHGHRIQKMSFKEQQEQEKETVLTFIPKLVVGQWGAWGSPAHATGLQGDSKQGLSSHDVLPYHL